MTSPGAIAKMAQALAELEYPADQYNDFRHLAGLAEAMVANSLDAFARLDAEGALKVIRADEEVDEGYNAIVRERGTTMRRKPPASSGP